MTTLFPPILENQRESIWFYSNPEGRTFDFRFQMPQANAEGIDIKHIQISVKYRANNRPALNPTFTPDNATLFFGLGNGGGIPEKYEVNGSLVWTFDPKSRVCSLRFPYIYFEGGMPKNMCEYTFQVRFGATSLWDGNALGYHTDSFVGFSDWFNRGSTAVPSAFGEWSNIQKIFCVTPPDQKIAVSSQGGFCPIVTYTYQTAKGSDGLSYDTVKQLILQYDWESLDDFGNQVRQYKTLTLNGQYNNDGNFSLVQEIPIAPVVPLHVSITAITEHNTVSVSNAIYTPFDKDGEMTQFNMITEGDAAFSDFELKDAQTDDGCIAKSVFVKGGAYHEADLLIYRYDLKTYECILIKSLKIATRKVLPDGQLGGNIDAIYTVKDYTIAMGEEYQYVPVIRYADSKKSNLIINLKENGEGTVGYARLMKMEMTFLNDRYHQLRIPGNLNVSAFKRNTSDVFQNTIGGEYPYYIRNGKQNYRTLQVSAVISINFDPTFTFLQLDNDLGLLWESKDSRKLMISRKDIFGVEDFSNSRWRIGYPSGRNTEQPKIVALGQDALDQWALLDSQLQHRYDSYYKPLYKLVVDEGYPKENSTELDDIVEWCRKNLQPTHPANRLIDLHQSIVDELRDKMNQYYSGGTPKSQQYLADYAGKSVYTPEYIRNDTTVIDTNHTDEMVYIERKFRDAVMSWLSDGKPKLYRSETEGNMIVAISQPSFTPLNKTQRMVYSVTMTLTEIAEYNLENLIEYDLIPSQIISEYIPRGEWDVRLGDPDPWVGTHIGLVYDSKYDIPSIKIEQVKQQTEFNNIDMNEAVVNNYHPPIIWIAEGLPEAFSLDCHTGVLSCNKNKLEPSKKKTAKIIVYDNWVFTGEEEKMLSYRDLPDPPRGQTTNLTIDQQHKLEYNVWWARKMAEGRHDRAEMIINIGDIYYTFLIGWAPTETGTPVTDAAKLTVNAVGEEINDIFLKVLPEASGVAPYSWGIVDNRMPTGLTLTPTGENSHICRLHGVFLEEKATEGNFWIVCTDSKFQTSRIEVTYSEIHSPIRLVEKESTSTLVDLEQGNAVPSFDYKEQTRYGTKRDNYEYELMLYKDKSKNEVISISRAGNKYNYGITIGAKTGILEGIFDGAPSYPHTSTLPLVIRVYDLGDPVSAPTDGKDNHKGIGYHSGLKKWYRCDQIEINIVEAWQKFEFIKPENIDIKKRTHTDLVIGQIMEDYDIMSIYVTEKGTIIQDIKPTDQHPVRGGKPRAKNPRPYQFYLRAPASGDTLPNFSISSGGKFSGVMTQTAEAGFLEIVAVDGRGHERSIRVEIPEVVGQFKIRPYPKDKLKIPMTYVGNPEDVNKEWFRIYSAQPDLTNSNKDDLVGEEGEFSNFKIDVEGLPVGISIVHDVDNKCFIFKGAPEATLSTDGNKSFASMDEVNAWAQQLRGKLNPETYKTNPTIRQQVDDFLSANKWIMGAKTHFATVTITDAFEQIDTNGQKLPLEQTRRKASHTILIEGVVPPFIWYSQNTINVPTRAADICDIIIPVSLPNIRGGQAPFRWTEESINAIKPYTLYPQTRDGEEAGGFDGSEKLYIGGTPGFSQPAKDVELTLVDAFGQKQTIKVHLEEITGSVGVQAAEAWNEPFIVNHSNANNSAKPIKVVFPSDGSSNYTVKYNGQVGATLPNGMKLNADGSLSGMATKAHPATDIGSQCTITFTSEGGNSVTVKCPSWWLPATVEQPKPRSTTPYVISGLKDNESFSSEPLFIIDAGGGALPKTYRREGDIPPDQLAFNPSTLKISGSLRSSTDEDLTSTFILIVGGNNSVTPKMEIQQTVVFKPVLTIFTLGTPDSGFSIPGLTKGVTLGSPGATKEIELTGDFAAGKSTLRGGLAPIKWHSEFEKNCGLTVKFDSNDNSKGRRAFLAGTPSISSPDPIKFTIWAEDATGQLTEKVTYTIPGIFDLLKVATGLTGGKLKIPAKKAGEALTEITLTASGGSGKAENYRWRDPTSIISSYGYSIIKNTPELKVGGNAGDRNMLAYNGTDRVIILKDEKTQQEVEVQVDIGAITDGEINISTDSIKLPNGFKGQTYTQNLTNLLIGKDSEKNSIEFEFDSGSDLPDDWKKNGDFGLEIKKTGTTWVLTGKYPNKAITKEQKCRIRVFNSEPGDEGTTNKTTIGYITVVLPTVQ